MRERPPAHRRVKVLPLPGDEGDVRQAELARAIRRDNRLNMGELLAKHCIVTQRMHGINFCLADACPFCSATDPWLRHEVTQRTISYGDPTNTRGHT